MSQAKRYLVTSALPYANGPLHVGHLAGAYIPADIYVRYLRLTGKNVLFICGSDEHGAAITIRAKKEATSPQAIVDKYHNINKETFAQLGISFDIYHRTSSELHHQTAQQVFKQLHEKGVFTEKTSEQYYDQAYQQFLADRYITGTCPKCSYDAAYGDQCENCGSSLSPTDLINPKSTLSGNVPVLKTTKHWYLPMDKYQEWVKQWIDSANASETWKKHVYGQCRSWLEQGLQERSMTRDLSWGVKVPLSDAEGKVLYVWLDAPFGYVSATKALTDNWAQYWKQEDTKLVHFIGKDNIVFHCIIFPILLHALGDYVLPSNVPANQFMNLEGNKMSTSRNYAVWANEYLQNFPEQEDVLRYVLTVNMPENKDSDFSWKDFQARNNNELVAILGNLVNRVLVLTHKYFDGIIPPVSSDNYDTIALKANEVQQALIDIPHNIDQYIHRYEFRNALNEFMLLARVGNKFLTETEPWKLVKQNKEQTAAVLRICLELIAYIGVYAEPFLPFTATKIKAFLQLNKQDIQAILAGTFSLPPGFEVQKPSLLFSRIDDKQITREVEKLQATAQQQADQEAPPAHTAVKDTIVFDDFTKLDIRIGTITTCEKVKKANKLLQLSVDLGFETRTIVSGIAKYYQPADIIGKQVMVVINLAPRKLRGITSEGMILTAEAPDGSLTLLAPIKAAPNGSCVA